MATRHLIRKEFPSSFEDPYTLDFKELYICIVDGKPIKSTPEYSLKDLKLFRMIF
jgi:hypothetical protein